MMIGLHKLAAQNGDGLVPELHLPRAGRPDAAFFKLQDFWSAQLADDNGTAHDVFFRGADLGRDCARGRALGLDGAVTVSTGTARGRYSQTAIA